LLLRTGTGLLVAPEGCRRSARVHSMAQQWELLEETEEAGLFRPVRRGQMEPPCQLRLRSAGQRERGGSEPLMGLRAAPPGSAGLPASRAEQARARPLPESPRRRGGHHRPEGAARPGIRAKVEAAAAEAILMVHRRVAVAAVVADVAALLEKGAEAVAHRSPSSPSTRRCSRRRRAWFLARPEMAGREG